MGYFVEVKSELDDDKTQEENVTYNEDYEVTDHNNFHDFEYIKIDTDNSENSDNDQDIKKVDIKENFIKTEKRKKKIRIKVGDQTESQKENIDDNKDNRCDMCGKTFPCLSILIVHKRTHTGKGVTLRDVFGKLTCFYMNFKWHIVSRLSSLF